MVAYLLFLLLHGRLAEFELRRR